MRIDLPQCSLKTCRYNFDHNCKNKTEYDRCEFQLIKSYIYFTNSEDDLRKFYADANRIKEAVENTKQYGKR